MKALVTGGAGFIGSNLVDALIEQGYDVTIIDNLSSGKKENINQKARLIVADIRDLEAIKPHFEGIDYVFHLAAMARVQFSIDNPVESHDVNINGTLNVLLAARDAKVKRLVYSASSSVYGDAEIMPTKEDQKPNPLSPYALQKHVGEDYCRLFSMFYGLETVCLRYFNVYGPRMTLGGGAYMTVIAIFLQQQKNGEKLTITGDGTQTRDFAYVADVARANILASQSDKVGKGELINIGSGDNHSVNQIAEKIGGEVEHIAPRVEPHDSLADFSRAKELLGWEPSMSFDQALEKTRQWFESL